MANDLGSMCVRLRNAADNSAVRDNPRIDRLTESRYSAWRMCLVRRHLPRVVVAWLFCHIFAFTALLPRECCAAHARGAHAFAHHESATAPAHQGHGHVHLDDCEMADHEGAACPMHAPIAPCAVTGACDAPAASLHAVLLGAAVLSAPTFVVPDLAPMPRQHLRLVQPVSLAIPPDAPPPKA